MQTPRAGAGLATVLHFLPAGLRDRARTREQERAAVDVGLGRAWPPSVTPKASGLLSGHCGSASGPLGHTPRSQG